MRQTLILASLLMSFQSFAQVIIYMPVGSSSRSEGAHHPSRSNKDQTLQYSSTDLLVRFPDLSSPLIKAVVENQVNNCAITGEHGDYKLLAKGQKVASAKDGEFVLSNGTGFEELIKGLIEEKFCALASNESHKCTYKINAKGVLGKNLNIIEEVMAKKGYMRVSRNANLTLNYVSGWVSSGNGRNGVENHNFGDSWVNVSLSNNNQKLFSTNKSGVSGMVGPFLRKAKVRHLTKKALEGIPSCVL